ncbi:MAG TPA: exopolysaccharide transport family protein [Candidatus Paceibacterota bacterium]|nr:exopolysaccharide transport family protein [Candidatus Paceibacterota bacterium]
MNLNDVLFVLFRRKKLILFFSSLGILAAVLMYLLVKPPYISEARLMVRYIMESKALNPSEADAQLKTPDSRGENIINSEIDIMTSHDVAREVVELLTPERILGKGRTNAGEAASMVRQGLRVDVPRKSNVIRLLYNHPDPEVAQVVLQTVVSVYRKKHDEIHRALGLYDDFLTKQTDNLRNRLNETEAALRQAKEKAGLVSVDDARKIYVEQIGKVMGELNSAEAELAERRAVVGQIDPIASTNSQTQASQPLSAETLNRYRGLCALLDSLKNREIEMLSKYTDSNPQLQQVRTQIADTTRIKDQMAQDNPALVALSMMARNEERSQGTTLDPASERARVQALMAKVAFLNDQLKRIRAEARAIDDAEATIRQLERKYNVDQSSYNYFVAKLEQARMDESLGSGRTANISVVQEASGLGKDTQQLFKMLGIALAGGVLAGIALAFLLEIWLDPRIKRPVDLEKRLNLPLYMTIPRVSMNGHGKLNVTPTHKQLPAPSFAGHREAGNASQQTQDRKEVSGIRNNTPENAVPNSETGDSQFAVTIPTSHNAPALWSSSHPLRAHFEALRDRVVMHFEGDLHKPKLLAVTSGHKGAGVTTIATALASTLSETGDGNVLLVDMNLSQGAAHPFYQGQPGCGLADALDKDTRQTAFVRDNLYAARGPDAGGQSSGLAPRKFQNMIPKLMASDYDYIIFDLPPMMQASVTPRLAHLMDMVLFVAEADKTNRDTIKRAAASLAGGKPTVTTVLNKSQRVLPKWMEGD